ncbi:MAG TPA: class I SAM-dependent methyltransferase, partial [Gemmatimonadales bacterium]|nr:class I SAM-dependent methyltransferase [Gemmatimonadales bacterium]
MRAEHWRLNAEVEERHWWFVGRRRIMGALVRRLAEPGAGHVVVDVGCGTGGNIGSLADEYGCVGVDPSPEAIELAAGRWPGVRFVCGEAPEALGGAESEAGVVLLMDVLEHVPDDFDLLSRLVAVLRPGAHLLITV